ncbi:NUDIX domain-containing protein [Halomicroarcula sp. GCM10025709]|uniref:NUDIX domain-containing protein n=1 Tax=Haloarcula TaxID=2237 RepID=UPI0024C2946E|nr:NUDIX domain-containing protein [Halomicroarcula sp. YJ-61-S]
MTDEGPVPDDAWATIVRNVPIVSVDLVVQHEGVVALGKRQNDPAKGEWFVPGGTVHKRESLDDAVHRIASEELGVSVRIERRLGVYEHVYDVADVDADDGKHYVPIGYLVTADSRATETDDQHADVRWAPTPVEAGDLHPYVRAYLSDAGLTTDTA